MYVTVYMYVHLCAYEYVHICMYVCMYGYVNMQVCMHACICVYICIHICRKGELSREKCPTQNREGELSRGGIFREGNCPGAELSGRGFLGGGVNCPMRKCQHLIEFSLTDTK